MKPVVIVALICIAFTAIVAIFDVWIGLYRNGDETISNVLVKWSKLYPILPFLVGLVIGHLFWK